MRIHAGNTPFFRSFPQKNNIIRVNEPKNNTS